MFPVAELCDEVEVLRTDDRGAVFRAEGIAVDCAPEENICMKAFRLMQRRYGVEGVAIRLVKRIPFGRVWAADHPTARPCCGRSTRSSTCGFRRRS